MCGGGPVLGHVARPVGQQMSPGEDGSHLVWGVLTNHSHMENCLQQSQKP